MEHDNVCRRIRASKDDLRERDIDCGLKWQHIILFFLLVHKFSIGSGDYDLTNILVSLARLSDYSFLHYEIWIRSEDYSWSYVVYVVKHRSVMIIVKIVMSNLMSDLTIIVVIV